MSDSSNEKTGQQLSILSDLNIERIFKDSIDSFSDQQAATAWAMIDLLEKVIEDRKKDLREALLARVEKAGRTKENGSFEAEMGGVTIIKEKRQAKLPDEDTLRECLKEANLEYEDAFSAQMKWVMDPSKVDFLIQGGKISAEKIESSKTVTYALKVKPDKTTKAQLDKIKKRLTTGE